MSSFQFSTFTQNGDSWTIHGTRQATQPPRVVYEWGTQLACDTKHPSYYLTPDQTGTKYGFNVTTGVDHFGGPCWYREYGTNTLDDLIVYYADQEYTFPWQTEAGSNPQGGPPRCRFLPGTLSPYTLSPSPPPPNPLPNYAVNHGQWAIYCTCLNNP